MVIQTIKIGWEGAFGNPKLQKSNLLRVGLSKNDHTTIFNNKLYTFKFSFFLFVSGPVWFIYYIFCLLFFIFMCLSHRLSLSLAVSSARVTYGNQR